MCCFRVFFNNRAIPGSPIVAVAFSVPKAVPVHFSASSVLAARFFTEKALDFGYKNCFSEVNSYCARKKHDFAGNFITVCYK